MDNVLMVQQLNVNHELSIYDDVFCIPYNEQYIIYLPLRGIIFLGNARLVNLLYQARIGNQKVLQELNINKSFIGELFNSEKQLEFLKRQQKPQPFMPTSVSLFLTNDCTLRCKYCYADGGSHSNSMSWSIVTGVLDQVMKNVLEKNSNHMTVHFHGGGDVSAAWSLLVRTHDFVSQRTFSNKISLRTSIGTNGYLSVKQRNWLIKNIDGATVSIDGPPDLQNYHRPNQYGGPSFSKVYKTLKAFDVANYPYGIRCTITEDSVHRLEEIVSFFCENFKTKKIKIEPMFPRGRASSSLIRSPDAVTFVDGFRKARQIARDAGREMSYSGARLDVLTNVFCQAAGQSCAVTPEGWITSCYEVIDFADPFAKLFFYGRFDLQHNRFIVDEESRKHLFDLSVMNKPFCAKCFCKWHCAGDCPVKSLYNQINPDKILPDRCYINRELTKDQLIEALHI
jgi:uncharacterized protein